MSNTNNSNSTGNIVVSNWPVPLAPSLIYKKMSDVMKDIGSVHKSQTNTAQGFKFRGVDQFVNSLYPALTKHGVFMTPRTVRYEQQLKDVTRSNGKPGVDKHVSLLVEYDFFAEDGSKVTVGPIAAEGLDSGDKATNKALSAALKYALIQTFSIPTEDMAEADKDSPEMGVQVRSSPITTTTATNITTSSQSSAIVASAAEVLPVGAVQTATTETKSKTTFRKLPSKAATKTDTTNGAASGW